MERKPQTWHYGLVARRWAEFNDGGDEIATSRASSKARVSLRWTSAAEPGGLLLPYLRAGLEADGCDVSPDMIALCREKAAREGFAPTLDDDFLGFVARKPRGRLA